MYYADICETCGALVPSDYWENHEEYHIRRKEPYGTRHSIHIAEAEDIPRD